MKAKIDYSRVRKILHAIESGKVSGESAEEILQNVSHLIFEEFNDFFVLIRFFLSIPFGKLSKSEQEWVEAFAEKSGEKSKIETNTPVLALLGSKGLEDRWNDRSKSNNHIGIPLLSSEFVDKFPMMSWVLVEHGVDVKELVKTKVSLPLLDLSNSQGIIYVADAKTETDSQGRKIIFAEDFVKDYGIKTVFGFGGRIAFSNNFMTCIIFSKETIDNEYAKFFQVLNFPVREKLEHFIKEGKIFID